MTNLDSAADVELRTATLDDVPALVALIALSARALCRGDYTESQVEAAIGTAWGVDTQLIRDGTYFIVQRGDEVLACGGWSKRKTLFGGDAHANREPAVLDPATEAARVRAFFVHPSAARQGIGRLLLERCEQEARDAGFRSAELVATLPGHRLYRAYGYIGDERVAYPLAGGGTIDFVPMHKVL